MAWIGLGFCVPFVLAFWLAAWTGARSNSSLLGALVGVLGLGVLMTGYVAILFVRVRSLLFAFVENELPLFISQFLGMVEQFLQLRDAI
ncbi:MAG: hypothetical protein ABJ263_14520 [Tateyamaria sp.]|uniref:hypothetical protein n=1 Tax=Tateyamaria sp. TaxID=1929288 RepID=UPI0032812AF0